MKKFETKSCEEIMSTAYKPLAYCVDGLLTQGCISLQAHQKSASHGYRLTFFFQLRKVNTIL